MFDLEIRHPLGTYAELVFTRDAPGSTEGVVTIERRGSGPKHHGRGRGTVQTLLSAWKEFTSILEERGVALLKCSIAKMDGRERTRRRVYKRAGFVESGEGLTYRLQSAEEAGGDGFDDPFLP